MKSFQRLEFSIASNSSIRPSSEFVPIITSTSVLNAPDYNRSSGLSGKNGSDIKLASGTGCQIKGGEYGELS